jgi:hypothetical protein
MEERDQLEDLAVGVSVTLQLDFKEIGLQSVDLINPADGRD